MACSSLPLRLAGVPLMLTGSCELPTVSYCGLWGRGHYQKSHRLLRVVHYCKNLRFLWRWGWAPGAQGPPGNAALGGWGRPPGHHGVLSVAPTKSEQCPLLHRLPTRTNRLPTPWPDRATVSSRPSTLKKTLSLCLPQSAACGAGEHPAVRCIPGNTVQAVWRAGTQGSTHAHMSTPAPIAPDQCSPKSDPL